MKDKSITLFPYLAIGLLIAAVAVVLFSRVTPEQAHADARIVAKQNLIGTGTSTPQTQKLGIGGATTSVQTAIGESTSVVDLDIYAPLASTSAQMNLQVLKSSLPRCTSPTANAAFVDANPQSAASGAVVTLNAATTTYEWAPATSHEAGTRIQITNWNADCMKLIVGGNGLTLYIQAISKAFNF